MFGVEASLDTVSVPEFLAIIWPSVTTLLLLFTIAVEFRPVPVTNNWPFIELVLLILASAPMSP